MKSLTSLKLTQRIKQGLYEYCSAFYKAKERYPTIAEMNEAFYIPNFLQLNGEQRISEAVISKTASILTEAAVARAGRVVRPSIERIRRSERSEREGRETGMSGVEVSKRTISPEAIDVFNTGKSPEEAGLDPAEFIKNLTPAEFVKYQENRQKAIDTGAPVTDVDLKLGLRTPQTPNEKPAENKDARKDTDRQAVVWATDRLDQIKRGEVQDMTPLDHALVAVDNVVGWATGRGEPTSKGAATAEVKSPVKEPPPVEEPPVKEPPPVEEPPAEEKEEIPTTRPPEVEPIIPPKGPEELPPVEEPPPAEVEPPPVEEEEEEEILIPQPQKIPPRIPKRTPSEAPAEEGEEEEETQEEIIPIIIPKQRTKTDPVVRVDPRQETRTRTDPVVRVDPMTRTATRTGTEIPEYRPETKQIKDKEKREPKTGIAPPAQSRPQPPEQKEKQSEPDTPSGSPSGFDDALYAALRAGIGGISQVIKEGVYDPKRSLQKKEKKQKFKVIVTKEGGKKVEIFASSLRGVKRIVYGKQNYRVFNQNGSDMTSYFKKQQKGK